MSKGWRTKADVLKDLSEVNGRRTGAEDLDQHVVAGEQPPPILHEAPDADEMSYFFAGVAPSAAGDAGPDLDGISVMLKMVNDIDETVDDHEPMTLYRNNVTDEIRISKLNPFAGEYVPGSSNINNRNGYNNNIHNSPNKSKKFKGRSDKKLNKTVEVSTNDLIPSVTEISELPKISSMFKSKTVKLAEKGSENENKETQVSENETPNVNKNTSAKTDIKEIQEKIKSTLIASTTDNSLQTRRKRNVAIATLLKMGMIPQEPVKLIKPDYFENPPSAIPLEQNVKNDEASCNLEVPSKSSSETDVNGIDQDSIKKVNGWFKNMECPKPKLPQEPLTLKENASSITFKKKTNSSVTSHNSERSKENNKEPAKPREIKAFKPSSYANDLLKKYEDNAQRAPPLIEDLGTRLERQLRERDEMIRQKLARQNAE